VTFGSALLAALFGSWAMAEPRGEQVVRGSVQFQRAGDVTTIHASNGAIINYHSFDIARQETVRFVQPSAASRVLNRIRSSEPTHIDGALRSNGIVYLVNPAGVIFGQGAVVDAAGLYAAAAQISDPDFARGVNRFTGAAGSVVNQGAINARTVALIGRGVANGGSIVAPDGLVVLAAGGDVVLTDDALDGRVHVRIAGAASAAPAASASPGVENTGDIRAGGGRVVLGAGDMYAVAAFNSGQVRGRDVTVQAAAGDIVNTGQIDASGPTGGTVTIRGERIGHFGAIRADGTEGDGGSVVIQASQAACIEGDISARGGPAGGCGGFVETSGGWLHVAAAPDVSAPAGRGGTWLLDPHDIRIVDFLSDPDLLPLTAGGKVGAASWLEFRSAEDTTQIEFDTLLAAMNLARVVIVRTASGGRQAGNITWEAAGQPIDPDSLGIGADQGGQRTLALVAHNDIRFLAFPDIFGGDGGGRLHLALMPDSDLNGHGRVTVGLVLPQPPAVHGRWVPGRPLPKDVPAGSALQAVIYLVTLPSDVLSGAADKRDLARLLDDAKFEAKKTERTRLARKGGPTSRPAGPVAGVLSMSAGDGLAEVAHGEGTRAGRGGPGTPRPGGNTE